MSNKPFIISTKFTSQPVVPTDSDVYNPDQETRVQILQAINGYISINMFIESCKLFWSFWHFQIQCPTFSYLSLGFLGINLIWSICSYIGFRAIRSKNSRNMRIFVFTVVGNLVLRIAMYIVCGTVMKGKIPNYIDISQDEIDNRICTALYSQTLYIITGIFEGLICLFVLFLLRTAILYVERWENSQTEKHLPKKLNNYSDY